MNTKVNCRGKEKPPQSFGFVRVAAASPGVRVADCDYNAGQIIEMMRQCERDGVSLVVFPELCLTGYTCADLFYSSTLQNGALEALDKIVQESQRSYTGFKGLLFVGMPLAADGQLFNCAVAIHHGQILGVVPKMFPPNYREFYECRWFRSGAAAVRGEVSINGQTVPFGSDLLFKASDVDHLVVGAELCEDVWTPIPPSCFHALHGATVLVNLSASNELVAKDDYRRDLINNQSARCIAAYLYSSCGQGESTTDLVFGGHCMISESGNMLAEREPMQGPGIAMTDIDLERLRFDRNAMNSWGDTLLNMGLKRQYRLIEFALGKPAARGLVRHINAHPFIPRSGPELNKRCRGIFDCAVASVQQRVGYIGCNSMTIGVSGGLDSTLALLTACKTADRLGWKRSQIHGFSLPGFGTTSRTYSNSQALMKELGVSVKKVNIRPICHTLMKAVGHQPFGINLEEYDIPQLMERLRQLPPGSKDLRFENLQARMRTLILMDDGFVLGTGDLSELCLGWCTYNGDHMSGYNPNAGIPKTLVKFLVRWAAENEFDGAARATLNDILATAISPELLPTTEDGKIAQKTESDIGPYELHDFFMGNMLRFWMPPEKILYLAAQARFDVNYSEKEIRHWLKVFIRRFFKNRFKHSALPDGAQYGPVSVSPRGCLRMPSDAVATLWLKWAEQDD